jgi:hypothetical protein
MGRSKARQFGPDTSTSLARYFRAWAGTSTTLGCVGLQLQPIVPAQHGTKSAGTMRPVCRHEARWPTWPSRPVNPLPHSPNGYKPSSPPTIGTQPAHQRSASWLYKPRRLPPETLAPPQIPIRPAPHSRAEPAHPSASTPHPHRPPRPHPRQPPLLNPQRPDLRRRPATSSVPATTR